MSEGQERGVMVENCKVGLFVSQTKHAVHIQRGGGGG